MTQEPHKNNAVLIVIAIIGVIGTICAATIGAVTTYNVEKLRQESELTRVALVSSIATQNNSSSPVSTSTPYPTYTQLSPLSPSSQPNEPVATPIPEIPTQPPVYIPPADPYPQLSLPFIDNFDSGFSSEWRIVNGQPIVSNGYLGAATDDVILEIGNNSLSNYTVSFDYKDTYNGTWLGGVSLIIAQKVKFETQGCPHWQALVDNKWTQISECDSQIGIPGKLRLTVNGNTYRVYINGTPVSEITYGKTLSGSFSIYVEQRTLIDNLTITSP